MRIRFFKRFRLAPGLYANLSNRGPSLSLRLIQGLAGLWPGSSPLGPMPSFATLLDGDSPMSIILGDTYAYRIDQFSVSRDATDAVTLVAEASDLRYRRPRQIYDDACDVGIAIQGNRWLVRFYLCADEQDSDGDTAGWYFRPIPEDARRCSPDVRVLIIND
jgi:hypothetical protein